jgi:hypothetical protein
MRWGETAHAVTTTAANINPVTGANLVIAL